MADEQAVQTAVPIVAAADVVVSHPVFGKLTRLAASPDYVAEIYRDEQTLMYIFYNNLLRFVINPNFWHEAELSMVQYPDMVQLQSAGQPIINVRLHTDIVLQEDFKDGEVIDA